MMKTILFILLAIHGLIHFLGFTKAFKLAEVSQLNQPIGKTAGIFWFSAGLLFLAAAAMIIMKADWWWIIALSAIIISQLLIIMNWQDAKFGSIANIILLLVVIGGFGIWNFHRNFVSDYTEALSRTGKQTSNLLTESDILHLPLPVRSYLRYSGVLNRPKVMSAKITFEGQMHGKGKDWMDIRSTQYNFYDTPTRLFYMTAKMKGLTVPGYHAYKNGIATMKVSLFGLFPVVNAKGKEMNQAETVTLFNDMCLMTPATLIDNRIRWEEIDSLSSKAIYTCNGITISAILHFNEKGQLINFISDDRYDISDGTYKQYRFSTPVKEYRNINGINVCSKAEVIWHYPEGEFVYGKFNLRSIEYNVKDNQK
ncbi:MAG: hypothetical protein IPF68_17565 [Bacteroidales bacterium]|nr:hypothetical protein [Bacteroidales bacterium]